MRADTVFRIASMTKPVTSVAVMMLYEEGTLLLTDPVSKCIPSFNGQRVLAAGPDAPAEPVPARASRCPPRSGRGWPPAAHTSAWASAS